MRYISLFSGIGGFDLGFDRAGFTCVAQVEIDEYCRKVLTKHWPEVPKYADIKTVRGCELPEADVIIGGFPCQGISDAGFRLGLEDERSGLWFEYLRLIREIRPRYVVIENVAALLGRGGARVLCDLAGSGYDAEWNIVRASDFGLPHKRKRIFIIAHSNTSGLQRGMQQASQERWFTPRKRTQALSEDSFWRHVPEPVVSGGNNGVSDRVGRSQGVGNAVVPQVAEYIARCVLNHAKATQ